MRRRVFLIGSVLSSSVVANPPLVNEQLFLSTPVSSAALSHSEHVAAFIEAVSTQNINNSKQHNGNISHIGAHAKIEQALAQFDTDNSIERLLYWSGYSQALAPNNFVAAFKIRKNKDFLDSKTVLLERWVVSRAELALCRLANQVPLRSCSA